MTARIIIVASHRRSGTHLVLDSLRTNGKGVNRTFMNLDRLDPKHPKHIPIAAFDERIRALKGTVLVKSHLLPGAESLPLAARDYALGLLDQAATVYVHRDGRDALVSLYHYVASYSSEIAALPFGEFIRQADLTPEGGGLNRAALWQHHVTAWLTAEPTARVGYERLHHEFEPTLTELGQKVGLAMPRRPRPVAIPTGGWRNAPWARAVERHLPARWQRKSTAIRPRSGGSGGWRAAFTDADLAWFEEQAGLCMDLLGYREGREERNQSVG